MNLFVVFLSDNHFLSLMDVNTALSRLLTQFHTAKCIPCIVCCGIVYGWSSCDACWSPDGGNIDVTILNRVITRGLAKSGRLCTIEMELDDKPGELVEVCSVIAGLGGNITGVHHDRSANRNKVNACVLRLTMETRDEEHVKEIKEALESKGFHLWIV